MATLVSVDTDTGTLRRYEAGGQQIRLTHQATPLAGPRILTAKMVENFRLMPDDDFKVEPPPRPTNPPASAGSAYVGEMLQARAA